VVAQMFARWAQPVSAGKGEPGVLVVPTERTSAALAELPVIALPLAEELRDWLVRLGILTIGELAKLPQNALGPRLEADAARVLELAVGRDREPLTAFQPARLLVETMGWEHEASGNEPLLFALRGLAARVSARLSGRGEAAQSLVLSIEHAGAFARFRGTEPVTKLRFALSTPLWREEQLFRVVASRLERVKLAAPSVGLKLEVPVLAPAVARQLDFGELLSGTQGAQDELPLILAELVADIGEDRVGVLKVVDSHRPEAQSVLTPVKLGEEANQAKKPARLRKVEPRRLPGAPTRLLPEPLALEGPLYVGAALAIDGRLYSVERIVFEHRLEGVEWWSRSPVARDYVRLVLRGGDGFLEALAYVERRSQRAFLQAIAD
jgi:protein ImuB